MESKITELKVSEKFGRLVQPIIGDELLRLEKDVSQSRDVRIFVYNDTIVDGYEKYELAQKLGIPIKCTVIPAENCNEAVVWLCRTQLRRNDLTHMMRKYLIGKRSLAEQELQNQKLHDVSGKAPACRGKIRTATRKRVGKEYNYSYNAVRAYESCAKTLDFLFLKNTEFALRLLKGEKNIAQSNLIAFAGLSEIQQEKMLENLMNNKMVILKTPTIKNMPLYDPDSEIYSLTLTVPSWINMIERAGKNITPQITEKAVEEIYERLNRLKDTAENFIEQIMEVL